MGKRQKRFFQPQLLSDKNAFLGKEASVITSDNRTVRGVVTSLTETNLQVQNMGGQQQNIELKNIAEIVLDFEAPY
jgi:L-2-hydroxyglutarate oxidase LhgO